ncbi:hypothetical protein GCM10028815_30690 [Mariniluteicoccus flavus]
MFDAMGVAAPDPQWRENAYAWFVGRLADSSYGIFVVDAGEGVVACAMGAIRDAAPSPGVPDGRDVLISNVCTFADHRGRGHGRRAFEAVLEWARSTGVARAELMATADGRAMYERAGFRVESSPAMRARLITPR